MTKPRRVLPGTSYMLTRRCSERRFFLRPDPEVTQIFEYLLGLLSKKHEIDIHAYVVMSNHYHLVLTDREGTLPDFQRELNSLLARSINAYRGRSESFWDRRSYNAVELVEDDDVVSKMAYTLVNPVAGRLVDRARQWQGATSVGMEFDCPRTIARPVSKFFSKLKRMPETAELVLTRPDCKDWLTDRQFQTLVDEEISLRESEAAKLGKAVGMARVMAQHWNAAPKSPEARGIQPRVASRNKWMRIEALRRSKEWLLQYKVALAQFVKGNREVEFPAGTWRMCARLRCNRASD